MAKKETAEQKLLKMIEASSGGSVATSQTQGKVAQKQNSLFLIKKINLFLIIGVIVATMFLVREVMAGTKYLTKSIKFKTDQNIMSSSRKNDNVIPAPPRLSVYLAGTARRNFFQPYEKEDVKVADTITDKNTQLTQRAANLRLVGISWLDSVDSASIMVEDTDKKVTYFLKKGERIGDIFVKTIYADSAVLGYENEEMTIKYDKSQM